MVNAILRDRSTQDFYLSYGSTAKIGFILHETDGVKGWRQSFAPAIAPQVRDSDYSYQHQNPLVDVALPFEDWHVGSGHVDERESRQPTEHLGGHAYNYSQGIDLSWSNRAYLSPSLQDMFLSSGANLPAAPVKFLDSTLGFFVINGQYIHEWVVSSQDWAERDDATGDGVDYTDLIEMDGVVYAARGDSADYKYSTNGTTWTAFIDADRNQKYLTIRGQSSGEAVLWGMNDDGLLRNTTDGKNSGVAWSSASAMGHTSDTSNGLLEANDDVYAFRREGIFRYNGTTVEDVWTGGRQMLRANNGKSPYLWVDQKVYVSYGDRLIQFDPGANEGGGTIVTSWPHVNAVGNDELNGSITATCGDGDNLYFALKNATGNTYIMKGNPQAGGGFHTLMYLGANDVNTMTIVSGSVVHATNPALAIGHGTGAKYVILPRSGYRPEDDTNYRFSTSEGVVYGTWVDAGTKAYKKFLNAGRSVSENVTAGMPITFAYEIDGGAEATLMTVVNPGEQSEILSTIIQFNRIRYVARMLTGNENSSPRLLSLVFNVIHNQPRKRMWEVDVKIGDGLSQVGGGESYYSSRQTLVFLEDAIQELATLYDRRGRTFTVHILDVSGRGILVQERDTEVMTITMVEVSETTNNDNLLVWDVNAWDSGYAWSEA